MIKNFRTCFFILLVLICWRSVEVEAQVPVNDSFSVSVSDQTTITLILITGNKRTRPEIIKREMSVRSGQTVATDSLGFLVNQNQLRIFNIALFNEVLIDTIRTGEGTMFWHVQVTERWYIWPEFSFALADRNFNVWWTEQNQDLRRANIGMTIKDRNFRGNKEEAGIALQVGYTQQFSVNYVRPYVDKKQRHGFGFSVHTGYNNEVYYNTDSNKLAFAKTKTEPIIRRLDATLFYTYRPEYATRHVIQLAYRSHHVHDTILGLNPEFYENGSRSLRMVELSYRFEINGVDNWNYPLVGHKMVSSTLIRTGINGMSFQYRTNLEAAFFKNIWGKWYGSTIFRGQAGIPERQPYVLRAGMGSNSDYLRGYEYYVIDGAHFGLIRLNLKRELVNKKLRNLPIPYLRTIPIRIYPKVFADAGYVENSFPRNSFLNNRFLYSAGIGLDIITAYDMKFRLEYTWNHLQQRGFYFHTKSE